MTISWTALARKERQVLYPWGRGKLWWGKDIPEEMLSLRTNVVDDLAKKEYEDANCERLKRQAEALRDRAKSMMRSGRLVPLTNA